MKRKVIQIGNFTKVVSLPTDWVRKYNIGKGDELDIEEKGNQLIIYSLLNKRILKANIDLRNVEKEIAWPLLALLHKKGYDEIKIRFDNPEILSIIQKKISSTLMSFEVIEQTKNSCVVKNITYGQEAELESLLRKIFSVTISLSRNSLDYINTGNVERMEELYSLEETNNKLTNLCERILNTTNMDINNRYLYHTIWLLESIADEYRDLCKSVTDNNIKLQKETVQIYKKVNSLLNDYFLLYYSFSLKSMAQFIKNQKQLVKDIPHLFTGSKGDDKIIAALLSISKRFGDMIGSTIALKASIDVEKGLL